MNEQLPSYESEPKEPNEAEAREIYALLASAEGQDSATLEIWRWLRTWQDEADPEMKSIAYKRLSSQVESYVHENQESLRMLELTGEDEDPKLEALQLIKKLHSALGLS